MLSIKQDLPQHYHLQIDQDHKFFSKLLSKDTSSSSSSSSSSPSFRVYYGVPFMWESQPGTSKYTLPTITTTTLPPLTPPPSFYTNQITKITKRSFTSNLFKSMFPKLNLIKNNKTHASSPSNSLSSSSSSFSSLSSSSSLSLFSFTSSRRHSRFSSARMSFSSFGEDHVDDHLNEVPLNSSSSLCFPLRSPYHRNGRRSSWLS